MYTYKTNTRSCSTKSAFPASLHATAPAPRMKYRARDFGVGYGSSSGYASDRRYASPSSATRFRCA